VQQNPVTRLTWRLTDVDLGGEWGWEKLLTDDLATLHNALVGLEAESLRDLRRGRHLRDIPCNHICAEAQRRLSEIARDDTEAVSEISPGIKKWRVWGIIRDDVFCLLWWDPEHTVCKGIPQGTPRR
jgi:hypothetical protein